jgi:hypothetical protein
LFPITHDQIPGFVFMGFHGFGPGL